MVTSSQYRPPKLVIIMFMSVLILLILLGGITLMRGVITSPQPSNSPTTIPKEVARSFNPHVTPPEGKISKPTITRKLLHIYIVENAVPRKVGSVTMIDNGQKNPLRIDDNGVIYYIEGMNVYSYSLASQEKRLMYTNTDTKALLVDAIMSHTGKLYVTMAATESVDNIRRYSVVEDTLSAGKTRIVGPISSPAYDNLSYVFNTDYGDILIASQKKDCATYGVIMSIKSEVKELQSIGEGCVESPKMVGYNEDFATIYLANKKTGTYPNIEYNSFDSLSVVTGKVTQQYDLTSIGTPVREVLTDELTAAFLTNTYVMLFDIEHKKEGAKTSIPRYEDYEWMLSGTVLYGKPYTTGPNIAVDTNTGSIRNLTLTDTNTKEAVFNYLGIWKRRPIFYVEATE